MVAGLNAVSSLLKLKKWPIKFHSHSPRRANHAERLHDHTLFFRGQHHAGKITRMSDTPKRRGRPAGQKNRAPLDPTAPRPGRPKKPRATEKRIATLGEQKLIAIRLPAPMATQLEAMAAANRINLSEQARRLIALGLDFSDSSDSSAKHEAGEHDEKSPDKK